MMKLDAELNQDHEIKIGAHAIKVKFVDPGHDKLEYDHGCYEPKEYTIYINSKDPESMRFSTFLHEALHAVEHVLGFEIDHLQLNLLSEGLGQILLQDTQDKISTKKSIKSPIYKKRNKKKRK